MWERDLELLAITDPEKFASILPAPVREMATEGLVSLDSECLVSVDPEGPSGVSYVCVASPLGWKSVLYESLGRVEGAEVEKI